MCWTTTLVSFIYQPFLKLEQKHHHSKGKHIGMYNAMCADQFCSNYYDYIGISVSPLCPSVRTVLLYYNGVGLANL